MQIISENGKNVLRISLAELQKEALTEQEVQHRQINTQQTIALINMLKTKAPELTPVLENRSMLPAVTKFLQGVSNAGVNYDSIVSQLRAFVAQHNQHPTTVAPIPKDQPTKQVAEERKVKEHEIKGHPNEQSLKVKPVSQDTAMNPNKAPMPLTPTDHSSLKK